MERSIRDPWDDGAMRWVDVDGVGGWVKTRRRRQRNDEARTTSEVAVLAAKSYLTFKEAANHFGVCYRTILYWKSEGLPCAAIGSRRGRVIRAEAEEWLKKRGDVSQHKFSERALRLWAAVHPDSRSFNLSHPR